MMNRLSKHSFIRRSDSRHAHVWHSNEGFTLVELLVAIVIVGILAAIAAPGWLSYANTRRANTARDQVLQVLRQAQAEAIRTRQRQVVRFDVNADPPLISTRAETLANGLPGGDLTVSLGDGKFVATEVGLQVTNGGAVAGLCPDNNCIAFDGRGTVLNPITDNAPVIISALAPRNNPSAERCVIVRTLLGTMQSANGDACQ